MEKETTQLKSHEKIFLSILSLLVVYVFVDYYFLDNLKKKSEETIIPQAQTEEWSLEYEEFWKDPEWKERARAYLEKTGGYDSSSQTNYTKEQKRQYVTSLIQSLSKSDIRILNDYLGYIV